MITDELEQRETEILEMLKDINIECPLFCYTQIYYDSSNIQVAYGSLSIPNRQIFVYIETNRKELNLYFTKAGYRVEIKNDEFLILKENERLLKIFKALFSSFKSQVVKLPAIIHKKMLEIVKNYPNDDYVLTSDFRIIHPEHKVTYAEAFNSPLMKFIVSMYRAHDLELCLKDRVTWHKLKIATEEVFFSNLNRFGFDKKILHDEWYNNFSQEEEFEYDKTTT